LISFGFLAFRRKTSRWRSCIYLNISINQQRATWVHNQVRYLVRNCKSLPILVIVTIYGNYGCSLVSNK
jgi:hypothetical protein